MLLNIEYFRKSMETLAQEIEVNRDYLTQLDSDIGDGDHGINLSIGFRAVSAQLEDLQEKSADVSSFLKSVGMILLSKVGGASGPLYGSFFMQMGKNVKGKEAVSFEEFLGMLDDGVASIEKRGQAELGDKTMVDALRPAVDYGLAHVATLNGLATEKDYFGLIVDKVKEGSDNTIPMQAKKGRALRLKERSIGHRDAGSASSILIFESFLNNM